MGIEKTHLKGRWRIRTGERQAILLVGDLIVTTIALLTALYFWAQKDWLTFSWAFLDQRAPFWFYMLPVIWILLLLEIYEIRKAGRWADILRGVGIAAFVSFLLYLVIFFISEPNSLPRRGVLVFIVGASVLTVLWRLLYIQIFTAPVFTRRVLIIGAGKAGTTLAEMISQLQPAPFTLVGFIDDDPEKQGKSLVGFPVVGTGDILMEQIDEMQVTDLTFAISGELKPALFRKILEVEESGIEVTSLPTMYEDLFGRVPILLLQSDWILRTFIDQAHTTGIYETAKRVIDIFGSLLGILFLIILFPLIALFIMLDGGFPVIYSQYRVGKNGRHLKIFKFRTMSRDAESDGIARTAVQNDQRITRVGKVLRRSHLDELPQVINILKGEYSIVGPRPEQVELVNQYQKQIPFYRARLFVRPGLTGWAQINQSYASTVEEMAVKLEYDLYYIKHRNIMLDLSIIFRTVGAVLGFRGR